MIRLEDRQTLARNIEDAHAAGARFAPACEIAGIELRTLERWKASSGLTAGDGSVAPEFTSMRHRCPVPGK